MAKKSKKRRSRTGAPRGKPGGQTRAQTKQRAQTKDKTKDKTKEKTKEKEKAKERRDLVAMARGTTLRQRVAVAGVIVLLAAVAGFFGGRAQGSPTFRSDRSQEVADDLGDQGAVGDPVQVVVDGADGDRTFCVRPADGYALSEGAC